MNKIFIYGVGGFALEVFEIIKANKEKDSNYYNFCGYIGDREFIEPNSIDIKQYIGNIEDSKIKKGDSIAIAIGKNIEFKKQIVEIFRSIGVKFPNIIHPLCDLNTKNIGEGNIIKPFYTCAINITIGNFNLFNAYNCVGHHSKIGSFNSLNAYVSMHGFSSIGNENILGVGSCLLPKAQIGDRNIIAPGSYVYKRFRDDNLISGNPATVVSKNQ